MNSDPEQELAAIDDALLSIKPDADSDASGTVLERAVAAAEMAEECVALRAAIRASIHTLKTAIDHAHGK